MALGVVKLIKRFNLVPESSKNAGVVERPRHFLSDRSALDGEYGYERAWFGALAAENELPIAQLTQSPGSTATIHLCVSQGRH